ncbi:hypothetical protein PR048_032472 [Dryococelus australis]|uniref:FLYWCH-type domain-containing protein n=1 Tax=Dryococelus australis TaxID=614101 RepID=A0ABQ9G3G4_9NEOP|nr:hypothetical protein PR048_032472 [Dryococelus australis]
MRVMVVVVVDDLAGAMVAIRSCFVDRRLYQFVQSYQGYPQQIFNDYLFKTEKKRKDCQFWQCVNCPKNKRALNTFKERKKSEALFVRVLKFATSSRGNPQLIYDGYVFKSECVRTSIGSRKFWRCIYCNKTKCHARVVTDGDLLEIRNLEHNHEPHTKIIKRKEMWEHLFQQARCARFEINPRSSTFSTSYVPSEHGSGEDIQPLHASTGLYQFVRSYQGYPQLIFNDYLFKTEKKRKDRQFWQCVNCPKTKCRARVVTGKGHFEVRCADHNHGPHTELIRKKIMPVDGGSHVHTTHRIWETTTNHSEGELTVCLTCAECTKHHNCRASVLKFATSSRGNPQLIYDGYVFKSECVRTSIGSRKFWRCIYCNKTKCHARVVTDGDLLEIRNLEHNHEPHTKIIERKEMWEHLFQHFHKEILPFHLHHVVHHELHPEASAPSKLVFTRSIREYLYLWVGPDPWEHSLGYVPRHIRSINASVSEKSDMRQAVTQTSSRSWRPVEPGKWSTLLHEGEGVGRKSRENETACLNARQSECYIPTDATHECCFAGMVTFLLSHKGNPQLILNNYIFKNVTLGNVGSRQTWRCIFCNKTRCRARIITDGNAYEVRCSEHNHEPHTEIIQRKQILNAVRQHLDNFSTIQFVRSPRGNPQLIFKKFLFNAEYYRCGRQFWRCIYCDKTKCRARVVTDKNQLEVRHEGHNHEPHTEIIEKKLRLEMLYQQISWFVVSVDFFHFVPSPRGN